MGISKRSRVVLLRRGRGRKGAAVVANDDGLTSTNNDGGTWSDDGLASANDDRTSKLALTLGLLGLCRPLLVNSLENLPTARDALNARLVYHRC